MTNSSNLQSLISSYISKRLRKRYQTCGMFSNGTSSKIEHEMISSKTEKGKSSFKEVGNCNSHSTRDRSLLWWLLICSIVMKSILIWMTLKLINLLFYPTILCNQSRGGARFTDVSNSDKEKHTISTQAGESQRSCSILPTDEFSTQSK